MYEVLCVAWDALDGAMGARMAGGGTGARLPRAAAWSAARPADKRPREVRLQRGKPVEAGERKEL